jgi:hypothetical protein
MSRSRLTVTGDTNRCEGKYLLVLPATIFMGAKASLLGGSDLPNAARLRQLLIHRHVEKKIFGEILSLPGEEDFLIETYNQT